MDSSKVTIPQVLHHWATNQPDTAAFIFRDSYSRRRVLTRADVYRLASHFAAILRRHDVRRGDLICNTLPNSPERVVSDMGIILAGAGAMNGQIFLADGEDFIGSLQDSRCVAVILDPLELNGAKRVLNLLEQEAGEDGKVHFPKLLALRMIYECRWESQGKQVSFIDMLERESDSYVADVSADDMAYVWTTSGSTGFSKLVPRTHAHVLTLAKNISHCCGLPYRTTFPTNEDSLMERIERANGITDHGEENTHRDHNVPRSEPQGNENQSTPRRSAYVFFNNGRLAWVAGFPGSFLWLGATRVLLDMSRGCPEDLAAASWTLAMEERCNYAFMLPFHLQQIVSRKDLRQDSELKLKAVGLAGQPVHKNQLKEAVGVICDRINVFYGSTELGAATGKFSVSPDLCESGNNGKPFPTVKVKVVDENLQEIPSGGEAFGEVLIRSDTVFKYYLGNDEATQKTLLADGWCRSGDIGYLDEEGDLFVMCRTSFGIIRGAYVIYPGWLESRIKTHPAVREVLVVPVPDPVLHQELCACVMTAPEAEVTAEELREFCEGLFLTGRNDHMTAVPRYFLFFAHLPTTSTGKPCRRSTTDEAKARLFGHA